MGRAFGAFRPQARAAGGGGRDGRAAPPWSAAAPAREAPLPAGSQRVRAQGLRRRRRRRLRLRRALLDTRPSDPRPWTNKNIYVHNGAGRGRSKDN